MEVLLKESFGQSSMEKNEGYSRPLPLSCLFEHLSNYLLLPFIVFGLAETAEWAATFTSWVMVACRGWWHF